LKTWESVSKSSAARRITGGPDRRKVQFWRQAMRLSTSEQVIHSQGLGEAIDRCLRFAVGFNHPRDVLKDPVLDLAEKRAVLSSWASDASAVQDEPRLRWLLGTAEPVPLEDIRDALARLDRWEAANGAVRL
jgi:hypothetical protein